MVADELRRQADQFVDLTTMQRFIERAGGGGPRMNRPMMDEGPATDDGDVYDDEDEDNAYN